MEVGVAFLILAVGGLLYAIWSGKRLQGWRAAAESCGLRVEEASSHLMATVGPLDVRIEAEGDKGLSTRIVVTGPAPPGFQSVTIRPEPLFQVGREIEIGDLHFDSAFFIAGPERLVLALLDAEVRRLILAASAESRLKIEYGQLLAVLPDEKVSAVLPLLLDIRKRFSSGLKVPRRLAENVGRDPQAGVRLKSLILLICELPDDPATPEAIRKASSDPNPEIRLWAAKEMGAEGRAILLELTKNLHYDAVSADAVSLLDRELPFERAKSILVQAMSLRRMQTAHACLEVLGRTGAAAVEPLAEVLTSKNIELAAAAAEALGATGSPAAEPALILALQRGETDLQVAAANALARVGSATAVLPLKDAHERSRLDLKLRRAIRQAIAEIQSRVQGASPGQLSLAGAEAGQLSLAQAEAGELSLTDDPAGRLSLPPGERAE